MELFRAHHQWANRPDDQKFQDLQTLHDTVKAFASSAREAQVQWGDLTVSHTGKNDLLLTGKAGIPAVVSHHAFGQLAARVQAPSSYLRTLPAELAADNLNHGLANRVALATGTDGVLLLHELESNQRMRMSPATVAPRFVARAVTTECYERLWDWEVAERLLDLQEKFNLVPASATMSWDGADHSADKALYASDHDMFVFLMARNRDVSVGTTESGGLYRGIIVANTEVGGISLLMMRFLFRDICQNHIIWGAKDVMEIRIPHRGDLRSKWGGIRADVTKYLDSSTDDETNLIKVTQKLKLGDTKEEVLDMLFGKRILSRKQLGRAYDSVVEDEDGSANTAWGFTQGLTRYSQQVPFADERTVLDRAGRKVLNLAF